jgi:hypothetical protein
LLLLPLLLVMLLLLLLLLHEYVTQNDFKKRAQSQNLPDLVIAQSQAETLLKSPRS